MKRKIILSLLALFLLSATGAVIATVYIHNTTDTLARLIRLHQIEDFRQNLIISIQTVQSELYTVGTVLAHDPDVMTENVLRLETAADECSNCHQYHSADIITRIGLIQTDILQYENALSDYITASANSSRITRLKLEAAEIGNRLLARTEKMSLEAAEKLASTTATAMSKIERVQIILYITMAVTFIVGVLIAGSLTRSITRPVDALVSATRAIAGGDLEHTIDYRDRTEFGELAGHFNAMSAALRDGYAKLEREIADRRQAQEALGKSESFLNTIFDSIQDPFCIFDREYRIVRANEAYAELKHRTLDELIGKECHVVLHGSGSLCRDCIVEKTFLSNNSCAKEKPALSADGGTIWLAIYTYPIVDDRGSVTHIIEYTHDITSRKLAEERLRESEERYALAARGANDGLWDWDLRTNRIHYSYRWKSMLGYLDKEIGESPEEWLGRIQPDDREQVKAKIAAHLDGKNTQFESEHRVMHRDGSHRWMLCRGLAVRDRDGKAYRMAGSQTDITARKLAEEQLLHDAFHDALTSLPNRALFQDRVAHVIQSSRRHADYQYGVLFLDLDRFKVINDSMGHNAGDLLLIEVGSRISKCLRPGDTVARLGGDEFGILLEDIQDVSDAVDVAERILRSFSSPFRIHRKQVMVTASIGIALKSDRYENADQVLRDADIAMYQAKAAGKARFEVFDTTMHASVLDRLQLEADMRIALEQRDGFVMHYQPIMDLTAHALTGFEALVRWKHANRGLIYPLEFIGLAEETGMITALSEWTMRQACGQLRSWQKLSPRNEHLKMSLNISSRVFLNPDFCDKIFAILEETGVPPACIALEITESIILENTDLAVATMTRLKQAGLHIHLDDFGTGYSSLSYLHKFPVNALKIDQSFISRMTEGEENREIVRTIIALARNLNLDVIAEGVEEPAQLSAIKELACGFGQGFYFARPMDAAEIGQWLATTGTAAT